MRIRSALLLIAVLSAVLAAGSRQPSQAPLSIDPEKTWALVIGVSNYTSEDVEPLQFAASDAESMAEFLLSPRGGGLRPDRVDTVLEGEATRDAVSSKLGFLGEKVQPGDSVYIFIAGHGFLTPTKRAYYIPADGTLSNAYASSLNFAEIKDLVEGGLEHAKVRILMTDVCHAGRLGPEATPPPNLAPNTVYEYLSTQILPKSGTFLNLLGSRPNEYSFESESLGQGVFTHAVLDALNGKSLAPGVTVADTKSVVEFVKTEVPRLTGRQQNPMSNSNFDPGMALAFLDRPGPIRSPSIQTSLVIRNTDRVAFERVEWFDSRYKARAVRRFSKGAGVVQISGLPAGDMEFKFSSAQNPARTLKLTLQPGENSLDILAANLTQYRFTPAGPIQLAALQPLVPLRGPTAQGLAAAIPSEAILSVKPPANATILVDGTEFTANTATDEYTQLTGLTPGIHNLTVQTTAREYRFRVRLRTGSQTFIVQTGEMLYAGTLPQDPALVSVPAGVPANLAATYRNFIAALWDQRLVDQPQGTSAWDLFTQMRNGLPAPMRIQLAERLAIAMGDRAQQTILKYLRGGDIQWSATVFEEGATLSDKLQQLFQFRPDIQRDYQSRQNFFAGRALVSRGRYAEGIQQLQRSIDLFPEASHSYNAIGLAYWQQGQLEQAKVPLQRAIALTPQWTYPRNILALVLLELRQYNEARQAYQDALLVNPEDSSLNHGLAQLDLQLGRVADAEPRLQRAIQFNPGNAYAIATYGRLESRRGNLDEAERLMRLAVRLEPDEPSIAAGLADLLLQRGQTAAAQQLFGQLARSYPSNLSVVRPYADFLASQSKLSDARLILDQAIKAAPKDASLHVVYGELLRTHQNGSDAEKQYKEALKSGQSNVFAHYGLANVYLAQGKTDQAEREIQAAVKADPLYPNSMALLGQIRSAQNRYSESVDAFDKALALAVEPGQQQEVKAAIEDAKRASAAAAVQSAKNDIDKNRMKNAWKTYTEALKLAPQDPGLIAALLKFDSDFSKDADLKLLPPSPVAAALQTPFWTNLRDAETRWKSGKQEDGLNAFIGAFDALSSTDRRKVAATSFNTRNDNYGIHQIVYRWALRAIELKDFTGAQKIMETAIRHKIFDFEPGTSAVTIDSLMIPDDGPEPATFADFEVAHRADTKAHEVLALTYTGQGNPTRAEEFLTALTPAQQADVRSKIQRLAR